LEAKVKFHLTAEFWQSVVKMLVLALAAAIIIQLIKVGYANLWNIDKVYNLFIQTVLAFAGGAAIYLGGAWLWRIPEIRK